jgi:hypothetical protein
MHYRDMVRTQDLCSDIMLNHHLSQKFNLIRNDKFNHLINILTLHIFYYIVQCAV